jgi:peptidyl-prolyl cis-trans isomerase D
MLRGIRKASSNWLGKTIMSVVMGVLILSFAAWGIADVFKGYGQSTLARIGSTEISTDQFRQLYTDKLQQIGRQFGRPLTSEQARAFGLDRQVLQQVVAEAALDEDARRKGLGVADAEVMRQIVNDPNFKGATGTFDAPRFQQLIRSLGYTEQRYIAEQRKVSLRRQIAGTVTAGLEPPKTLIEALSRFQNETRAIEYVKIDTAQAGTIEAPSPEALAAYFEDHKTQFRAPEFRKVAFVAMTPDEMAKWSVVTDDDAKKVFEERKDRLATPEQRQLSQIVFPTAEEAQAGRAKLNDTFSFADLAKERNLTPSDIDLGMVTKAGIIDPAVANVAFSLAPDGISQPITGRFGITLIKVGKIEPGNTPSYDSVAVALKRDLALERARAAIADQHNKMEDERGGGSNVVDAAKKLGLNSVTVEAVDRSGRTPDGQPVTGIPAGSDIVSKAFASDVGVDNDAMQIGGGYVWFDVLGVTPSRDRALEEVNDQVAARWRDDQISTRLRGKAVEMAKKLEGGGKLADEATAAGLKVETTTPFKRDASVPNLSASIVEAVFRGTKDAAGQGQGATGAEWIVYRVTDVTAPPVDMASDEVKKLKETLLRGQTDEQVAQYVTRIESQIGTKINEDAVALATGATNNANN